MARAIVRLLGQRVFTEEQIGILKGAFTIIVTDGDPRLIIRLGL